MTANLHNLKCYVAALCLFLASPLVAQDATELLDRLKFAGPSEAMQIERELVVIWSRSGSKSMDMLLERGRRATRAGNLERAVEHLTALTDHAPDFAEGWNARAIAFYEQGMFGESIADIGRALALNPHHFGAMAGLGLMLEDMEQFDDALRVQRKILSIHPNRPGVKDAVARLERKAGQSEL